MGVRVLSGLLVLCLIGASLLLADDLHFQQAEPDRVLYWSVERNRTLAATIRRSDATPETPAPGTPTVAPGAAQFVGEAGPLGPGENIRMQACDVVGCGGYSNTKLIATSTRTATPTQSPRPTYTPTYTRTPTLAAPIIVDIVIRVSGAPATINVGVAPTPTPGGM